MKTTIIRFCDYLIDYIVGSKPDNLFTAILGDIANYLEQKECILFDNVPTGKMVILVSVVLIALA